MTGCVDGAVDEADRAAAAAERQEEPDGDVGANAEGSAGMAAAPSEEIPTGGSAAAAAPAPAPAPAPAELVKPVVPQRAHPPPTAPIEAFPPWAIAPPVRSPRHVAGTDAKYVLKPTQEAFYHRSLTGPEAVQKPAEASPKLDLKRQQSSAHFNLAAAQEASLDADFFDDE